MSNQLLSLLSNEDQQIVFKECETVSFDMRQTLIEEDEELEYVYFPLSGIVSQLVILNDGNAIEAATIGRDGFVGISAFLGSIISPVRYIVQVRGEALRLPRQRLLHLVDSMPRLRVILGRYADFLMGATAQTAACNRLHNVVQRCARWLLRVHDRLDTNEFALTQEFLAHMLGVRRASVSIAAGQLQDAGFIRYNYARVAILDRDGLEGAACECAVVIRRRYQATVIDALNQ